MLTGDADIDNKQIASLAIDLYNEYIVSKNTKIPGFGHRYHNADPRADKLMELVIKEGCVGPHTKLALAIEDLLLSKENIRLNVDGANAAILSDLGFDPKLGLGVFIIGRVPALLLIFMKKLLMKMNLDVFVTLTTLFMTVLEGR